MGMLLIRSFKIKCRQESRSNPYYFFTLDEYKNAMEMIMAQINGFLKDKRI